MSDKKDGNTYQQALALATDRANKEVATAGNNLKVVASASLSTSVTKDGKTRKESVSVSVSAKVAVSEEPAADDCGCCSACGPDCNCGG